VDPWADAVAGVHGRYLAERMTSILPALTTMIASRTRYLDDVVVRAVAEGITQVLIVGVGFDTRMARLPIDRTAVTVYEVDLADMIAARDAIIADLPNFPQLRRETAGINLEIEDVAERIVACTAFSPKDPAIVLMEGVSVYLNAETNEGVLASLRRLLQHPRSRLVVDIVAEEVASGSTCFPDIRSFVEGMRELGEPFLFGVSNPTEYFKRHRYRIDAQVPSNYYRGESPDELYAVYNFFIVSPLALPDESSDGYETTRA
jgi:methyltransferase (TIGR00027 family)